MFKEGLCVDSGCEYFVINAQQRSFFDHVAETLVIDRPKDWNIVFERPKNLPHQHIAFIRFIRASISNPSSLYSLLKAVYQDTSWQPWIFEGINVGLLDNNQVKRDYMEWLGDQLGFTSLDDW